jgi:electron transport complex protein RnfB
MASTRHSEGTDFVDEVDALLPQTQCTKCGYAGCRPYAEAIVRGEAGIDQCPPGGAHGIVKLATLLQRPIQPLNPRYGVEQPRAAALIREELCIGCTLCIQACPVDAIVGAAKQLHTVLLAVCTGCELCMPPCPVDCIDILPLRDLVLRGATTLASESTIPVADHARLWRQRYDSRQRRLARGQDLQRTGKPTKAAAEERDLARKRGVIQAALERARARRSQ